MGLGGGMGWMWVFWLLVLVGLALVAVVVVRVVGGGVTRGPGAAPGAGGPTLGRAREVLDERYARGELTTDEYRERLRALGGPGSAADQ